MISEPLKSVDAWVNYIDNLNIPVLTQTQIELAKLRKDEDNINIHDIGHVIHHDALMALHVLHYLQRHRSSLQITDITTLNRAILMLGSSRFFKTFTTFDTIEKQLSMHPKALNGIRRVLQRAHLAATCADIWGGFRFDIDNQEVTIAALLRDTAEIILWYIAPTLMLRIRSLQKGDKHLRSHIAQKSVLGFSIIELQLALVKRWQLPKLLAMLMDENNVEHPRVRIVKTAMTFSRHSMNGWEDAGLPDDFDDISKICGVDADEGRRIALKATLKAAHDWHWYQLLPSATYLISQPFLATRPANKLNLTN